MAQMSSRRRTFGKTPGTEGHNNKQFAKETVFAIKPQTSKQSVVWVKGGTDQ